MSGPDWSAPLVRDLRDGRFHFVHREPQAAAAHLDLQLEGGPQDGGTYRCPTVYPGPDGLPDGILLISGGHRALYIRTRGVTYQHATYREKPADD
jgi:hypothetical protein